MGFGWNLGNHFDSFRFAPDATPATAGYWDGATPTEELYKNLAAAGVKTVRIPVTWGDWEGAAPDYTIDPAFMAVVRENVEWARDNGLVVILNMHHDEYWQDIYTAATNDSVCQAIGERIGRTWSQVAEEFKNEGNYLYLEVFNEIHAKTPEMEDWDGLWCRQEGNRAPEIINEWGEIAVRAIRATGEKNATRWIVLNGYAANPALTMDYLRIPEDEAHRLMLSVHTYFPVDFTLQDTRETWGVGEEKEADEAAIIGLFEQLRDKYTSQGIPVYLGEFGCDAHATEEGEACRLRYLTLVCEEAAKASIPVVLWDNANPGAGAEHHAYFDHNNGENLEPTIIAACVAACK